MFRPPTDSYDMVTTLLDEVTFKRTFATPMRTIFGSLRNELDIWPYVWAIPTADLEGHTLGDGNVEHVCRNALNTFDHALVGTQTSNVYLVIVVDLVRNTVLGHHLLDLNREYGLPTDDGTKRQ